MTPAEEACFIQLWQQGVTTAAIAQQLGIPRGTVASRAYALAHQRKIQARPKGGAFPTSRPDRANMATTSFALVRK